MLSTAVPAERRHDALDVPSPQPRELDFQLRSSRIMAVLLGAALALLVLHLLVVASYVGDWRFPIRERFYFDAENNLPTFFSTLLLLISSVLAFVVSRAKALQRDPFTLHWRGIALVFFLLSIDEAASFHELLINPLRTMYGLTGFLWFGWVIAGAAFVLAFAVVYWRFLWHLAPPARRLMLIAGGLYVGGALVMEMVGGYVFLNFPQPNHLPYMVVMTLEESMEIAGVLVLIHALLQQVQRNCSHVRVRIGERA
jgi:hypothetical protein